MKDKFIVPMTFISIIFSSIPSFRKYKPECPIEYIPHKIQTGSDTFGYLLNGKVFFHNGPILNEDVSPPMLSIFS